MMNLINRFALSLPGMRRLMNDNGRLRRELTSLRAELLQARQSQQLWVPAGHFYSPIVNPADEAVQSSMKAEAYPAESPDVYGISEREMLNWFDVIAERYTTQPFPELRKPGSRYFYSNPNFPLADALALLAFMVTRRPRKFVEIGAGFSSCAAIDINQRYLNEEVEMTFIEPHPELALDLVGSDSPYRDCFLTKKVQDVPLDIFRALGRNDILFIDSSHVGKTGSDVLDYLFRLLPCLGPNVLVQIHDIFYPFEYPKAWIADQNRSWNEAYLLRAFLHGNTSFRVLYLSDWFYKCRRPMVEARMPLCIAHRGGSLWLETTTGGGIEQRERDKL